MVFCFRVISKTGVKIDRSAGMLHIVRNWHLIWTNGTVVLFVNGPSSLWPQVLATGLSGLYSSLPTKLEVPNEEWHCLHREDWLQMPSLVQFLNSLEFCNAVIQVKMCDLADHAHTTVLHKIHIHDRGDDSRVL